MPSVALFGISGLLRISTIAETILSFLTLADVVTLQHVCRSLQGAVQSEHQSRLNVNHLLGAFVKDCDSFRYNLAFHDGLLVGGAVLEFLEQRQITVPRLDILLKGGPCAATFIDYLCSQEHYARLSDGDNTTVLHRPTSLDRTLHIIKSETVPIHSLLHSSHTTAELNFMSWNKIYSMFPVMTIVKHKLYPLRPLDDQLGAQLAELAEQGWTSRDIVWLDLTDIKVKHIGSRRVGDPRTLAMPLYTILDRRGQTPDSVLEHAEFYVCDEKRRPLQSTSKSKSARRELGHFFSEELSIQVQELASLALRYTYTTSQSWPSSNWRVFVEKRLERWIATELYKIPSSRRPLRSPAFGSPFGSPLSSLPSRVELPASWDYADDQMPLWYRQWEEQRND